MFLWCSGYHIRLTRGRSRVQSSAETIFSFYLAQFFFGYHFLIFEEKLSKSYAGASVKESNMRF